MSEDKFKWKLLSSEYLFDDTWLRARRDTCQRPDGKIVTPYYVMEYPTWVTALAITEDDKVVLVKQYRHAIARTCIETPGGCVDATDENLEAAIKREMVEETGFEFENTIYLGKTSPNPSTNNNLMHMFVMTGGRKVTEQQLDPNEEIEVLLVPMNEFIGMLERNEIIQAMHVTTIFYAFMKLGKIKIL